MPQVHRVEVRSLQPDQDPRARHVRSEAQALGLPVPEHVEVASVYLLEGDLDQPAIDRLIEDLLCDPVTETAVVGIAPVAGTVIEVHPRPGVTDPEAEAVEFAAHRLLGSSPNVRTGTRYDFASHEPAAAADLARRALANEVIQEVHAAPHHPEAFRVAPAREFEVREVALIGLDDTALMQLSREAHLFLSLEEMREIRDRYQKLGRNPREIELETLAQTWSEHCVHKTLKSRVRYEGEMPSGEREGVTQNEDGSHTIDNLLANLVAAPTNRMISEGADWLLSVFVDNSGVVAFDDEHAVCFKVETHNHPSAIEPYGGAATGIGGCIRDVIGTGLGAKPIAATDVFCVADPDLTDVPSGCLPPRRILQQVVAGVRDYGNRMGIPTLNGGVWFDDRHVGNPLVFCGVVGVMPRAFVHGDPKPGDRIIAVGGRTGRDGIHGATFSSAELSDTHADEFSHAVQIGNPIVEKKFLDALLEARDHDAGCLFRAMTDCGAGGFSSAIGEMGEELGAEVQLERAPLKYDGLTPTEIWISEAQERMVLAVPEDNIQTFAEICTRHDVEWCDLGVFGTPDRELILRHHDVEVGRLPMSFLHDGIPRLEREATFATPPASPTLGHEPDAADLLSGLVGHPNLASKHWIIRQYDHEVQGGSVAKPLVGPHADGPGNAAVVRPVPGSERGLAIANGLATAWCADPYRMGLAAIDECVRNLVCTGADPERIAILDNFCWPGCDDEVRMGELVRASLACYDGATAYGAPFISGKDSLNNQFRTEEGDVIRIPPTLLISGFAPVEAERLVTSMDAKSAGNVLLLVGTTATDLGGAHVTELAGGILPGGTGEIPLLDLQAGPANARAVARAIRTGSVCSAHDLSEGGLLVAAAEMGFAGRLGIELELDAAPGDSRNPMVTAFAETPSRYLLEVAPEHVDAVVAALADVPHAVVGRVHEDGVLRVSALGLEVSLDALRQRWLAPLDW
ncbi:MAG: phosphoribosylformylglycinamidine synthase subunit PurS [Planctomycetota bacterium]|nr:phosphoribosylformylglycinamidine synthase subunit PurS [Planctomycetota bacterium]